MEKLCNLLRWRQAPTTLEQYKDCRPPTALRRQREASLRILHNSYKVFDYTLFFYIATLVTLINSTCRFGYEPSYSLHSSERMRYWC